MQSGVKNLMTYFEYTDKLENLKYLVARKQAGRPCELAQKLHVSERSVLRMVQQLREHGYPIKFNRLRGCYELKNNVEKE